MKVLDITIEISTNGENDIVNISEVIARVIDDSKLENGIATVLVVGSTAAITTIEYESGLRDDFPNMLSRIAPNNIEYEHDNKWHDENGHSHVRASLIGPSITIPFKSGHLALGLWQQIVPSETLNSIGFGNLGATIAYLSSLKDGIIKSTEKSEGSEQR